MVNLFEQFSLLAVLFCLGCSSTCFTTAWHCSMATTSSWAWHCSSARQGIVHQHGIDPGHGNLEKILMKTSVTIRMQCHRLLCICHVVCCVVIIIFFYYYFPAATLGETTATTPAHCQWCVCTRRQHHQLQFGRCQQNTEHHKRPRWNDEYKIKIQSNAFVQDIYYPKPLNSNATSLLSIKTSIIHTIHVKEWYWIF